MSDNIDLEIEAIKTILKTLQDLDDDNRKNVIEYVLKRIGFILPVNGGKDSDDGNNKKSQNGEGDTEEIQHIKQFRELKQPKSALEMAVIIAYYLQYVAEAEKRKDRIGVTDLQTWFRIADYPLPRGEMRFVLVNTKNAGYIDSVGNGEYKLNAIGYNLVKHNLPRQDSSGQKSRTKTARKKNKKATKKSAKK